MDNSSPPDYKKLLLQAEEGQRLAEERQREAEEGQRLAEERQREAEEGRQREAEENKRQVEEIRKQAEEGQRLAEERQREAEENKRQVEEIRKQAEEGQRLTGEGQRLAEERNQRTTFLEFMRYCHSLLSQPLKVETRSRSTTGTIPLPKGKFCPTRLRPWTDCLAQQQAIYNSVCNYLHPAGEAPARLFAPLVALEDVARRFALRPISSEQGLETYERIAVEDHVRDVIAELCKVSAAREEFRLGDGVWFDNHTNALAESQGEVEAILPSSSRRPRPDQFCIHRVDGSTNTVLLTVEYKPPHKLSVENLRVGLRPMELWEELVKTNKIPTDAAEKLRYNAEQLVNSAVVQAYDVMIEEGRAYSILTTGLARVLLHVPYDDPATLYYHLCEPNEEIDEEDEESWRQPKTSICRVLCLCLLSFRSPTRDQKWRNSAQSQLHVWETNFKHARSLIPREELQQNPPPSDSTNSEHVSPEPSSEFQPSSPPLQPPAAEGHRVLTRSQASCRPSSVRQRSQSSDSPGSDTDQATGRKRGFSQVTSSPSAQRATRRGETESTQGSQSRSHDPQFCTQKCLLGLRIGGALDDCCPNVKHHRRAPDDLQHPITSEDLVRSLKAQLDENIDRCMPIGSCGAYGAPFKLSCTAYGYTVVGKGTTSGLWKEVSREAQVYRILQKAQGSAVPVFLGTIDLAKIYFLHGAGRIRHMLVMGWGGENTAMMELEPWLDQEIRRSTKEIEALGIVHEDLRLDNILWNEELGRAMIIDFHRFTLKCRPTSKRSRKTKGQLCRKEPGDLKRPRVL